VAANESEVGERTIVGAGGGAATVKLTVIVRGLLVTPGALDRTAIVAV
jgi:hypothetical protein